MDRKAGAYSGDVFLDDVLPYLAPDIADPGNTLPDAALEARLRTVSWYLQGLAVTGHLHPMDVETILNAVDLSAVGVVNEPPQPPYAGFDQQVPAQLPLFA